MGRSLMKRSSLKDKVEIRMLMAIAWVMRPDEDRSSTEDEIEDDYGFSDEDVEIGGLDGIPYDDEDDDDDDDGDEMDEV